MTATTMAADLARAVDPVRLCSVIGMEPDEWQTRVLRSRSPRLLLNCSRQSGKSTVASVAAYHQAHYRPGSLVLLVAPSERQSKELYRNCLTLHRAMGRSGGPGETRTSLELANGSRVVVLPGNESTVRGFSGAALVVLDEASRIPDEIFVAIRPMVAVSGGRLIAMSTPAGPRGWWWEAWTSGGQSWERVEVPATAVPRISPEFLEGERRSLGRWAFEAEYLCRFTSVEAAVFSPDDLAAVFGS